MSLWWNRGRILRAVSGELPVAEEQRLRRHLAGCAACRARYDQLSLAAAALAPASAHRRERDRLLAALAPAPVQRPAVRRWAPALALAAAAAVAIWWVRPRAPESRVVWRGPAEEARAPVRLLLHASRKGEPGGAPGPLRLVADLPGAGEGKISVRDYLQLSYVGLDAPAYATVVAVDEGGAVHQLVPRPEAQAPRVEPTERARGLGPSVDLGRQRPGRLRVQALFSDAPLDGAAVRAAARGKLDGVTAVRVGGLLIVEP